LDQIYSTGAPINDDGTLRLRRLLELTDEEVSSSLPYVPTIGSGGAGPRQDDGLAGWFYSYTDSDRGESGGKTETYYELTTLYYSFGGVQLESGGGYQAFNSLYADFKLYERVMEGEEVLSENTHDFGSPVLLEKYTPGSPSTPSIGSPALVGLAYANILPKESGKDSIGLFGVLDQGMDQNFARGGLSFNGRSQIVDVQTDFNSNTSNDLVTVMDFQVTLHGALAAANERGSLFTVAEIPRVGESGGTYRAVMEFDPRNNYIKNAWSTANSDLAIKDGTTVNANGASVYGFGLAEARAKGAAFADGHLVVAMETGGEPIRGNQVVTTPQYFTFNVDATNTANDPRLRQIDAGAGTTTALSELTDISRLAPVPQQLSMPNGPVDNLSVNHHFAKIAYSQQALDSGVVRNIFQKHFQETAIRPCGCTSGNAVFDSIPSKLGQFVNMSEGFGRAVYELRNPNGVALTSDNDCAAYFAQDPDKGHADTSSKTASKKVKNNPKKKIMFSR